MTSVGGLRTVFIVHSGLAGLMYQGQACRGATGVRHASGLAYAPAPCPMSSSRGCRRRAMTLPSDLSSWKRPAGSRGYSSPFLSSILFRLNRARLDRFPNYPMPVATMSLNGTTPVLFPNFVVYPHIALSRTLDVWNGSNDALAACPTRSASTAFSLVEAMAEFSVRLLADDL